MHRFKNHLITTLVTGFAAMTTGCTDAETSIFVQRVIRPEASETGCVWDANPDGEGLLRANLDVGLATSYRAVLAVGNQLIRRGDEDTLKPESNRVQFFEVEVEVFNFEGASLSTFKVPATGFADPSAGPTPSYGAVDAVLVDSVAASQFTGGGQIVGQTIVSRVIVRGITLGGTEVQTAPWDFPIKIKQIDPNNATLSCKTADTCDDERIQVCDVGQDVRPDCRDVEDFTGIEATPCF